MYLLSIFLLITSCLPDSWALSPQQYCDYLQSKGVKFEVLNVQDSASNGNYRNCVFGVNNGNHDTISTTNRSFKCCTDGKFSFAIVRTSNFQTCGKPGGGHDDDAAAAEIKNNYENIPPFF